MQIPDIPIRDDIRLGQFLKYANLVETGGIAKELIRTEMVQVNGEVDTRRGKVLRPGDEVTILGEDGSIVTGARVAECPENAACVADGSSDGPDPDDDLGEYFDEATADDDFDPEKWRNM
ncbi:RNA-binding S4 domain-containing protein [uncultured Corynebacterium sp.]|uniref:RNA-binding S4 domain-containing protein n=1 Tax=uncultured Corynebacterium sp. TaxID=159447 RepID=UPI0025F7C196|nr:RNA-binding S4 domain-containing protein [uncultured Corynebacterium sp.]